MDAKPNALQQAIRYFAREHFGVASVAASAIAAGALLLATAALTAPALAQNNSSAAACAQGKQDAVAQIQQAYHVLSVGLQNQATDAETTRAKGLNDCRPKNTKDCVQPVEDQYTATMKKIQDHMTDLQGSEEKAMRTVSAGICAPSAAELAQLISSLGQAASEPGGETYSASDNNGSAGPNGSAETYPKPVPYVPGPAAPGPQSRRAGTPVPGPMPTPVPSPPAAVPPAPRPPQPLQGGVKGTGSGVEAGSANVNGNPLDVQIDNSRPNGYYVANAVIKTGVYAAVWGYVLRNYQGTGHDYFQVTQLQGRNGTMYRNLNQLVPIR